MPTNEVDHTYNSLNQQLHSFHSNQTIRSPSANRVNDALQPPSLSSALPTLPATTYSRPAPASPKRLSLSTNLVDHSLGKRHDIRDEFSPDPREFYLPFHDPFGGDGAGGLDGDMTNASYARRPNVYPGSFTGSPTSRHPPSSRIRTYRASSTTSLK